MSTPAPLPRHLIPSCFESHLSLTENSPFPRVLLDVIMEYVAPQILVVASGFTLNTFVQGEEGDTSLSNAATPKLSPNYYQPITNAVSTKYFPSPHLLSTHASTNPSDAFITDVVTSAHGHVVTSSYSGRLTVWDMSRQTQWNGVPDKQGTASYPSINASSTAGTPIHSLLALSDGRIIAGASNGKLHIFNYDPVHGLIPAYTSTNIVRDKETVCSMVEVHDSGAFRYLLPEDDDKKSEDMTDAKDTSDTTMTDDPAPINAVYVISACESSVLKLWRILPTRCELLRSISGHAGGVICLANMSDGRICSGSWDKTIKIWDVTSPTIPCVATLTGHTQLISALTVLPHLNTGYDIIISGSMDKSIRIWCTDDQNTYRCTYIQNEAHTTLVRTLKMMPDGSALISSSNDNSVSVWPVSRSTGRLGPALPLIPRVEEGASRRVYLTLAPEPNWHALLRAQ